MNHEPHDDLDRLLFALPLEEPPADLRASILASTIYRASLPIKAWEATVIGILTALVVWFCVLIARGGADAFMGTLSLFSSFFVSVVLAQSTWVWLAVGGGIAFILLILNLSPMPVAAPQRSSRR